MTRPVLYPLRPVETAMVRFTPAQHHRRRVTIDHRPLAGVTPEMLLDWFTHLGGTMSYGGVVIHRYLAWHPIDHIRWELARPAPGGGAAEGARFRLLAPLNRAICRQFPHEMLRAWVKHNIEEVGQLEYLLPQLKSSGEAEPAQRA